MFKNKLRKLDGEDDMKTITAKLTKIDLIEVRIKNSFYNGITKSLTLQKDKEYFDLEILEVEKSIDYTIYYTKLKYPITFGCEYEVFDDHHLRTPLTIDAVVRSKDFDEMFYYDGELGNFYSTDKTEFRVWSPIATHVKVDLIYPNGENKTIDMNRQEKGVWNLIVAGDLDCASYVYLLKTNGEWKEATDPYAYSSTPNHKRSYVIDLEKTNVDLNRNKVADLKSFTDAIIYEMHVRDFSINPNSNIKNKGKFLGVVEEGTKSKKNIPTGLDYLKDLGITHVQLMPVYDFGSVDEENQLKYYNWGYDPVQFNVPEGSYVTDVNDSYKRVTELKMMISKLHEAGLKVNMDVVYNHMFDMPTSAFNQIMPGYYFRFGEGNKVSNGSFCGNDIASDKLMVRKYIIDSCSRWFDFYGFDGFRFDLMGILDLDTMSLLRKELDKINPSIMLYGEGWHMPTLIDDDFQASMRNYKNMGNIGHFNDRYRDMIKGPHQNLDKIGFTSGNLDRTEGTMNCILGTTQPIGEYDIYLDDPCLSINYSECHDNYTMFDQLSHIHKDELERVEDIHRLTTGIIFVSQGIAFLHGGQEFFRTKNGVENSYMSPDSVNWYDWDRRDYYLKNVEYVKGLIEIRKSFKGFRLNTSEEIKKHVSISSIKPGVIDYNINYNNEEYRVLINATKEDITINLNGEYKMLADKYNAGIELLGKVSDSIQIERTSLVILTK